MKNKHDRKLIKTAQKMYLARGAQQINQTLEWVVAIENYIATHTLPPRCPETEWKNVIWIKDIRNSTPHLKGFRLCHEEERLIERILEERDLCEVTVSTSRGKILFQHK